MNPKNPTLKDEELFALVKQDDSKAFETLFRKYYSPLCKRILSIVNDPDAAEDVIQQLFIKIWDSRADLNVPDSVIAYLTVSARNRALNYLKSSQRKDQGESLLLHQVSETDDTLIQKLESKELQTLIDEAIDNLPEKRREIFKLSRFEGLSYKEIAERQQISVKTVEAQMGKALQSLREFVKSYQNSDAFLVLCLIAVLFI